MSIALKKPQQLTVDTLRIEKFDVNLTGGVNIAVYFSKGYTAGDAFIAVERNRVDLHDPVIDPKLRDAVKSALYKLVDDKLDAIAAEVAARPKTKLGAP